MCLPLHFVATLLHLVVVLVLLAHGVVHSTFLLARAGSMDEMKRSRTTASSVITRFERLRSGVQRIRAGEQQFHKLCLRRAALQWSHRLAFPLPTSRCGRPGLLRARKRLLFTRARDWAVLNRITARSVGQVLHYVAPLHSAVTLS